MAVVPHDQVHLSIAPIYWEGDGGSQNDGEYEKQQKSDCDHQLQTSKSFGEGKTFSAAQLLPHPTRS